MKETQRHESLPAHLTDAELQAYIKKMAVTKHTDTLKRYYTPEEIAEFEHEWANSGREVMRLSALLEEIKEVLKKGTDEDRPFTIPATAGTKLLGQFQGQNYQNIEQGFEELEVEIFGIVNTEAETMEFFTLAGELLEERTRPLSAKEKKDHLTTRRMASTGARLTVDSTLIDTDTGELLKTGTNG